MIRPLSIHDIPAMMPLAHEMHRNGVYAGYELDEGQTEHILQALIEHPDVFTMGAFKGDELIGAMLGEIVRDLWVKVTIAIDHIFYIGEEHRGSADGVKLIRLFEQWALQKGADVVRPVVYAGIDNEKVGTMIERMGYAVAGGVYKKELGPCA
jgi:GNAT superfamily N-acetyltransferase